MSDRQGVGQAVSRPERRIGLALAVVVAVALALAALTLAPASAPAGDLPVDYPLCTADGEQVEPAAHGDRVVWVDYRPELSGDDGEIWMFDYATGEETQLTDDEYEQSDPDLWGDWVVFYDYRNGNGDIYAKNVVTGEELAVCTDSASQQRPRICDDLIVWEDSRGGGWDVYYYAISSGAEGGWSYGEDRSPDVYHDGEDYILAWEASGALVLVNNDTIESRILPVGLYGATLVAGDGEFLWGVFEDREATGNARLYLYRYGWDYDTPVEIPTDHEPYAEFRTISASGDKVAYAYSTDFGFRVRVHDWAQGTENRVSGVESSQYGPAIAGDTVVWRDDRNYAGVGENYYDLYTSRDPATEPETTALTITAAATIVPYKGTTTLTVHLEDEAGAPLAGYDVDIQKSIDWGATWTTIGTTASDGGTFVTPALTRATKFRATWAGTDDYAGSTSSYVLVKPQVALQNPDAPTVVTKYTEFVVSGTLQPRHMVGWNEAVKLYCYKKDPTTGKWVLKKSVWCRTVDYLTYSKYRVTTYLGSTGLWKLRAFAPEDALHAATWSTSHYLTVK